MGGTPLITFTFKEVVSTKMFFRVFLFNLEIQGTQVILIRHKQNSDAFKQNGAETSWSVTGDGWDGEAGGVEGRDVAE